MKNIVQGGGQPVFCPSNYMTINNVIKNLYDIAGSDDYIRDMRINEKLAYLLMLLMEESWHPELVSRNRKKAEIVQIKAYLDNNYNRKISLDELSNRFYINKYYMMKLFSDAYGSTINSYINSIRVTKAKHLLRFSDKRIGEICTEVGFDDSNYFSRLFKKTEGMSPSEYRKKW